MTMRYPYAYRLEGHTPVPLDEGDVAGIGSQIGRPHVGKTTLASGVFVSTVFLCIDHNFGSQPPLLFETMVFGGALDKEQDRYATWKEAENGHAAMVARVIACEHLSQQSD